MDLLFSPRTIAVIGASRTPGKIGHEIFKGLLKEKSIVYAVNPNAESVLDRKSYKTISELPKIDLAVIAIPSEFVADSLEECGKAGVKYVIIISSGFKEVGNIDEEKKIEVIAKRYNLGVVGPNCLGVIDTYSRTNMSFFEEIPDNGGISFVSQSGALGSAILDYAIESGMGVSKFISLGNMAGIDFADVVEYLDKDPKTKVICIYVESFVAGRKFFDSAKKCKKPIIVLKAGKSKKGSKTAQTHTGSLSSEKRIYTGALKQAGCIEVDSLWKMFNTAKFLEKNERIGGRKLCVVTNAGGPAVLTVDIAEEERLKIEELPKKTLHRLNEKLPAIWSHSNPIDIVGDATSERYRKVFETIDKEIFYDVALVIITPQIMTDAVKIADAIVSFSRRVKVPVFACLMGGKRIQDAAGVLLANKITVFREPKDAVRIISLCVHQQ